MTIDRSSLIPALKNVATRLRIDSLKSTSEAASGHPTTCCSMAELMAALFFAEMRFDPKEPHNPDADRFVLEQQYREESAFAFPHVARYLGGVRTDVHHVTAGLAETLEAMDAWLAARDLLR